MGVHSGPANARHLPSAILTAIAFMTVACVALAAPADFSERDLSPPQRARAGAAKSVRAPVKPAAYAQGRANEEDTSEDEPDQGDTEQGVPPVSATSNAPAAPNSAAAGA